MSATTLIILFIILQVFCACAVAYVLSLSLALSVTAIASLRYHHSDHTHHNFTPSVQTPACLTTESACRFHQPAEMHRRGKDVALVVAKRVQMRHNKSQTPVQQAVDIEAQPALKKNECNSPLSCKLKPLAILSKITVLDSRNKVKRNELKTRRDTPGDLRLSSLLFTKILLKKLVLQYPCPTASFMDSYTSGLVQNNFVLSNVSGGIRNIDWWRSHTNGSYTCVA